MINITMPTSLAGLLFGGFMLASAPAAAEYLISYRYDGDYVGATTVSSALSSPSCTALPLVHLEIRNGILRAYDERKRQIVKGFVTGDGFFTSDYIFADGRTTLFEGIVDRHGQFTGGIIDDDCAWVVRLSKTWRG